MGINYPILREEYAVLTKPLLIITGTGHMQTVIGVLSGKNIHYLNERLSIKKNMQVLRDFNSEFIIYPYAETAECNRFLEVIEGIVRTGSKDSNNSNYFNALPVVVAENIPFGCNTDLFFIICLDGQAGGISFDRYCVVPPEGELAVVFDKFNSCTADTCQDNNDEKAFLAAASFLYPFFRDNNSMDEFRDMLQCAKKLTELDENSHNINDTGSLFISGLYKWQENTGFCDIYMLPDLEMSVLKRIDSVICFNSDYVYIKEPFFREISAQFLNIFSEPVLKKALKDDGILCTDNSNTYTVKMCYHNIAGELAYERMLRFSRDRLEKTGEPGFVEICLSSKENRGKGNIARLPQHGYKEGGRLNGTR